LKIYARLFPLVGGGSVPASPAGLLFTGLSVVSDDNEFVNISVPNSPSGNDQFNFGGSDDDKASTIAESEETSSVISALRQNSSSTTFSTLKTALLHGISGKKGKYIKPLTTFFFLSLSINRFAACSIFIFLSKFI
jgi:hypothetical protein